MIECIACGDEIEVSDDTVHLTVKARKRFRDSWNTYARLHVDCFTEAFGEGRFDADAWLAEVSD